MVSNASDDLPEPGEPGDDDQPVARQIDVDVPQVVDARAANGNPVVRHGSRCGRPGTPQPVDCTARGVAPLTLACGQTAPLDRGAELAAAVAVGEIDHEADAISQMPNRSQAVVGRPFMV